MSTSSKCFPIEEYFRKIAKDKPETFPGNNDYWERYWSMLTVLREQFYKKINVGLAVHSGSIAGIYTDHSGDHFDEVVKYAGKLAGIDNDEETSHLRPFEVYLLLMGIRLHDVGNIFGRAGHEKRALDVFKASTAVASRDRFETQAINKIALCHGGKRADGSKDTISELAETDHLGSSTPFRPRMVAALVRLADEICEHRGRVSHHDIESGVIPSQNLLYHLYADAIRSSVVNRREKSVTIEYVLHKKYLVAPYEVSSDPHATKYLLDEVIDRLAKLNLERIYCNQFLDPPLQISLVRATLNIVDGPEEDEQELFKHTVEIRPEGYPTEDMGWRKQVQGYTGSEMKQQLASIGVSA